MFAFHLRGLHSNVANDASNPFLCVVKRALKTLTPEVQKFAEQVLENAIMPSASTISRLRLSFDTAWMENMRDRHRAMGQDGQGLLLGLMDSSPQGRDYLMHRYRYLTREKLAQAAAIADKLYECERSNQFDVGLIHRLIKTHTLTN